MLDAQIVYPCALCGLVHLCPLFPGQHGPDEAGAVHGCPQTCHTYLPYSPTTPRQCPTPGSGWQWETEFNAASFPHVSVRQREEGGHVACTGHRSHFTTVPCQRH